MPTSDTSISLSYYFFKYYICYFLKLPKISNLITEACVWCEWQWELVAHITYSKPRVVRPLNVSPGIPGKKRRSFYSSNGLYSAEEPKCPILHTAASVQTVKTISILLPQGKKTVMMGVWCLSSSCILIAHSCYYYCAKVEDWQNKIMHNLPSLCFNIKEYGQ